MTRSINNTGRNSISSYLNNSTNMPRAFNATYEESQDLVVKSTTGDFVRNTSIDCSTFFFVSYLSEINCIYRYRFWLF